MSDVEEALKEIWLEKNVKHPLPKVTFFNVGKRHHVVFFPKTEGALFFFCCCPFWLMDIRQRLRDKIGNCKAGFVTTRGLESLSSKIFIFKAMLLSKAVSTAFVSYSGMRMTSNLIASRSGHYIVLKDENFGRKP